MRRDRTQDTSGVKPACNGKHSFLSVRRQAKDKLPVASFIFGVEAALTSFSFSNKHLFHNQPRLGVFL